MDQTSVRDAKPKMKGSVKDNTTSHFMMDTEDAKQRHHSNLYTNPEKYMEHDKDGQWVDSQGGSIGRHDKGGSKDDHNAQCKSKEKSMESLQMKIDEAHRLASKLELENQIKFNDQPKDHSQPAFQSQPVRTHSHHRLSEKILIVQHEPAWGLLALVRIAGLKFELRNTAFPYESGFYAPFLVHEGMTHAGFLQSSDYVCSLSSVSAELSNFQSRSLCGFISSELKDALDYYSTMPVPEGTHASVFEESIAPWGVNGIIDFIEQYCRPLIRDHSSYVGCTTKDMLNRFDRAYAYIEEELVKFGHTSDTGFLSRGTDPDIADAALFQHVGTASLHKDLCTLLRKYETLEHHFKKVAKRLLIDEIEDKDVSDAVSAFMANPYIHKRLTQPWIEKDSKHPLVWLDSHFIGNEYDLTLAEASYSAHKGHGNEDSDVDHLKVVNNQSVWSSITLLNKWMAPEPSFQGTLQISIGAIIFMGTAACSLLVGSTTRR